MKSNVRRIRPAAELPPVKTSTGHTIDRGIPIPARIPFGGHKGKGRVATLDLSGLQINDSVLIPAKNKPAVARARTNISNAAKRAGIKTTQRAGEGGVRVWRVG